MWAQLLVAALGIWLMAAPAVLGYAGAAADSDRVAGPVIASVAVVALWEVVRGLRWVNLLPAAWLVAAPWVVGFPDAAAANSVGVGLAILVLAPVRGRLQQRFGGGWSQAARAFATRPHRRTPA